MLVGITCAVSCVTHIPYYFIYEPISIIDGVPWICSIKPIFYTSSAWVAFASFHRSFTPYLAFILILLFNALTVRDILVTIRVRKRLLEKKSAEKQVDAETESRKKSIVLLFCVSGGFILLWFLFLVRFLYTRIAKLSYLSGSSLNNSKFLMEETAFMLQLLSFCINPFIYVGTQKQFRTELMNLVKYPANLIVRSLKL